jgi:glycine hydroxymethyltransferase
LIERGYTVLTGGTDNHIVLLDLRNKGLTGRDAETLLEEAGITVNKNLIPYDPQPPLKASGIRLGTPALTTRGFGEEDFRRVAGWIDAVLSHPTDAEVRRRIREEIRAYLEAFPLPYPPTGVVAVG